jgi:hypothetical protein
MDSPIVTAEGPESPAPRRRSNLRTALVLATVALAFFIGVIVNRFLFPQ